MRLSCPACNAETSLDVLLGREADARATAAFLELHVALGSVLVGYIGLFRPPKRRLAIARVFVLLGELLPDIERGAITRKGRDWAAPRDAWKQAIEAIHAKRDKGTLTLPLTSHGLLLEVLCNLAEKAEASAEAQRENDRRERRLPGPRDAGPRNLADMAEHLVGSAEPALPPAPPPAYSGPSRAALAIRAEGEERRRRASGAPTLQTPQEQP
jgi:hypothetical protein